MSSLDLKSRSLSADRPHISLVLAMSADGKISDTYRTAARFPSANDQRHLEQRVATADATLFGAGTLRAYGTTALVKDSTLLAQRHQNNQRPQPIHIVCSLSGKLDAEMNFFKQPISRWLLTTQAGAKRWQQDQNQKNQAFEQIWVAPRGPEDCFDWPRILTELKQLNIHHLLVMGGGQLVAALMAADLIDELWLTVCPLFIGGDRAPTPCDGPGFSLDQAPTFTLISSQTVGNEVFLNYQRQRSESSEV